MSSGVYNALSGALSRAHNLEIITNNLANANTVGFKKDRPVFETLLRQAGAAREYAFMQVRQTRTDLSSGNLRATGNPFDLAVEGEGFFKIQVGGEELFTRQGNFSRDPEGFLITTRGERVLGEAGPVSLPEDKQIIVDEEGRIWAEESEVGRLLLFTFADPRTLQKRGLGMFAADPRQALPMETGRIRQGHLETSNVELLQEMARLTENLRAFETCQKAITNYGNLSSKLDELGSVG